MLENLPTTTRPLTGDECLESLRDSREVYVYGERVDDVTAHPAFRNTARSIARLYNALHDEKTAAILTTGTDTGSGGITHKFFRFPTSAEDCVGDLGAIAEWARLSYGWLGRSPDYKAAFLATLGANSDFYEPYQENALRWYREAQEKVLYWNHAIIHPPVDRNRAIEEAGDVFMHVEDERDDGLIVSGAKVVATGSALTHYNFIAHYGPVPVQQKQYAIVCAVAMDTPAA
jgi:aromatic ring hydroxylase